MKLFFIASILAPVLSHSEVTSHSGSTYFIDFEDSLAMEGRTIIAGLVEAGALTISIDLPRFEEMVVKTTKTVADSLAHYASIRSVELNQMDNSVDGWQVEEMDPKKIRGNQRRLIQDTPYGIQMANADWDSFPGIPQPVNKVCVIDPGYDNNNEDLPTMDENTWCRWLWRILAP